MDQVASQANLTSRDRVALGSGSLAVFVGYTGIASLAVPFYQMTLGVSPILLGTALAMPRLWEAFLDPVVGNISDNFRSRWGRRRPLVFVGAILLGLIFGLTWMVPPAWSESAKVLYFGVMSVLFFTAYTIYSVPYAALTYEASPDYHERTRVMAHCALFNKLGEFGYQWIFPLSQLTLFASAIVGIRVVGWTVGFVCLALVGAIPALLVPERPAVRLGPRKRIAFWGTIRAAFANRPFLIVAGLVLLNTGMGTLTSSLDQYVLVYYVFDGAVATGATWKAVLSSEYALVGIGCIPAVVWISRRLGKRETLQWMYAVTFLGGCLKWVTFNRAHPLLMFLDPILCGPIWIAAQTLLGSMLSDICDEDERVSGQRREGMFGAMFSWLQKSAVSASFLGAGVIVALCGFNHSLAAQHLQGLHSGLRMMLVAATALPPLLAILLLRWYDLDAERAEETRQTLDERGNRAPATDFHAAQS